MFAICCEAFLKQTVSYDTLFLREGEEKEEMSTTSDPSQPAPLESDKEATGGSNSSVAGDVAASTGTSLPPLGKDKPAYLIRWNRFEDQVCNAFAELFCSDQFVDVTLACDGELIRAHKIVLAMSSPFFRRIFQVNDKNILFGVAFHNLAKQLYIHN